MIHWLVQPAAALPDPLPAGMLGAEEAAVYAGLTVPKRRADWLLGRITAKQLVQVYLEQEARTVPPLDAIAIAADTSGAPYASLHGERLPISLSISHSHATAFCALVEAGAGESLGCDIELVERRDRSFAAEFFTERERAQAAASSEPDAALTALWSAKEAALKALRAGLRIDTRRVEITLPAELAGEWSPLEIAVDTDMAARLPGAWHGWVRRYDLYILTVALFLPLP